MTETVQQKLINNINRNNTNTNNGSGDNNAANKLFSDFDDFLTLLTTQLKNQDPLSPLETSEFTNQLVGFAQVEQQLAQTKELKKVTENLEAQTKISAINHVGLSVEYEGQEFTLEGETANIGYELPEDGAGSAALEIKDEDGRLVARYNLSPDETGRQNFEWDGYRVAKSTTPRPFQLVTPEGGTAPEATFEFKLPYNTDSATVEIKNGDGTVVATRPLTVTEDRQSYVWDGQGTLNGVTAAMPEGPYTYEIKPVANSNGPALVGGVTVYEAMPAGTYKAEIKLTPKSGESEIEGSTKYFSRSRVRAVETKDGEVTLNLLTGKDLDLEDVLKVQL